MVDLDFGGVTVRYMVDGKPVWPLVAAWALVVSGVLVFLVGCLSSQGAVTPVAAIGSAVSVLIGAYFVGIFTPRSPSPPSLGGRDVPPAQADR